MLHAIWAAAAAVAAALVPVTGIPLDLRYATANNFTHQPLYPVAVCLLTPDAAARLQNVAQDLAPQGLRLKLYDCYRPLAIQRRLWQLVPDTRYVANPATGGSRHNRGSAVDLTLIDSNGHELPMGTGFDDFTSNARLTPAHRRNRDLLRRAMTHRGFLPLSTEWWHFDDPAWAAHPVLDLPLATAASKTASVR